MYIIYIKSYKKKIFISAAILLVWAILLLSGNFFLNNSLLFKVTINDFLTFSYPLEFQVENIFVNDKLVNNSVETSAAINKPRTQKFSTFTSIKGKFSFNYPSIFTLSQKDFAGSDILYHIDYKNKSNTSYGFVQVWNLPYSLKNFLDTSKNNSQLNYKYFSSKAVNINNLPGYLWDYSFLSNTGKYYKGTEVFLKKNNKMYRISYFMPEKIWDKQQSNIFWNIVYSLKTY